MELSLERVADAVMALRIDLRDRPDLEKRQLPRFPVWAPRTIRPVSGGAPAPFEVWLIDIACGGIGYVSTQPLDAGNEFHVSIPAADLLMQRKVDNWPFWILVNTIAVPLYASRELYLTSFLYGLYWINAIVAWIWWRRLARDAAGSPVPA